MPVNTPAPDKVRPEGRLEPVLTVYDAEFVADKVTVVIGDPVRTSVKAVLVVHTGTGTVVNVNALSENTLGEVVLSARTVKL